MVEKYTAISVHIHEGVLLSSNLDGVTSAMLRFSQVSCDFECLPQFWDIQLETCMRKEPAFYFYSFEGRRSVLCENQPSWKRSYYTE